MDCVFEDACAVGIGICLACGLRDGGDGEGAGDFSGVGSADAVGNGDDEFGVVRSGGDAGDGVFVVCA